MNPLHLNKREKETEFRNIIKRGEKNNLELLSRLSRSKKGCVNMSLRQIVWPIMVRASTDPTIKGISRSNQHRDFKQVALDINRSAWLFIPAKHERKQIRLWAQQIINKILFDHPELYYYQGFHDIVICILLVLGRQSAFHVIEKLSLQHLSEAMKPSVQPIVQMLDFVFVLVNKHDKSFRNFYHTIFCDTPRPLFAISWVLTWFSHTLNDINVIARIFDFLIASHPLMSIYISSAIIVHCKESIINCTDYPSVHSFFQKNLEPILHKDLEPILLLATEMFNKLPPKKLNGLSSKDKKIPPYFLQRNDIHCYYVCEDFRPKSESPPTYLYFFLAFIILIYIMIKFEYISLH